ncbi:MAG: ABC transporter substrate-binding protein, partial [Armatimonadetes bacterium]|nr:ABC transporter substrate-binding protein [Armatimonadota bacterium]
MTRRLAALGLAGLLGAVLAAGPQTGRAAPSGAPDVPAHKVVTTGKEGRAGGTLVFSSISDPRTFNSIVAQETSSTVPLGFIHDGLVELNYDTTELEPALAESWTVSRDGLTWTFKLRRNIQWHDGTPLTADDVIFTFTAIFMPGVQTSSRDILTVKGKPIQFRKIDTSTVEFKTSEPFGPFLRSAGLTPILPRHKLESALAQGAAVFNRTWGVNTPPRELVGTGPFIMQQYTPGQRIIYLRNPRYWKVDKAGARLPYLARLVIQIVPNLDVARLKFEAKETDIYAVRPRDFATFKAAEGRGNYAVFEAGPSSGTEFLTFNQNPRGVRPPKLAWFQNTKFRQAVSYAVDRNAIARQVYGGRAQPHFGPVSPANKFFYNPQVKQYPHDPRQAERLLAEAGFRKGPD